MFYLVATPIGNLGDFSPRAVDTLNLCDYILAEDTRHSRPLLDYYGIKTPLRSFHKFNESKTEEAIIEDLKEGKKIALISDAGTPGISDPGEQLVKRCRQEAIAVTSIPGASAFLAALSGSGFPTTPFQFVGFLPKQKTALEKSLFDIFTYLGTSIAYESPYRLEKTLETIEKLNPTCPLCVTRELTKMYEEWVFGTAKEILAHYQNHILKGEIVLLFHPTPQAKPSYPENLEEHLELLQETGLSKNEALKVAASVRGVPKRELYKQSIKKSTQD